MSFDNIICKKLKDSYNSNILKDDQEFLKKICDFIISSRKVPIKTLHNCNYTLIKLIYNRYFKHIPIVKNIVGPCSLTLYHSKKYNKTIYVFGEYHCDNYENDKKCPPNSQYLTISNFLESCSRNSPVFLDIFLEYPRVAKKGEAPSGLIGNILTNNNMDCFTNPKKSYLIETCSVTRWHYVDIRFDKFYKQTSYAGYIYFDLRTPVFSVIQDKKIQWDNLNFQLLINFVKNNSNLKKQFAKRPRIEGDGSNVYPIPKLINLLKSMGVTNPNHFSYRLLVYILYILFTKPMEEFYVFCKNKNIERIRDWIYYQFMFMDEEKLLVKEIERSYASDNINYFLNTEVIKWINNNIETLSKIGSEYIFNKNQRNTRYFFYELNTILSFFGDIGCLFTDSYLLARIFKTFNLDSKDNMPETPKNCITYAGERHAENYRIFLEKYIDDFVKVDQAFNNDCPTSRVNKSGEYQCCLDLSNFSQPLFNPRDSS